MMLNHRKLTCRLVAIIGAQVVTLSSSACTAESSRHASKVESTDDAYARRTVRQAASDYGLTMAGVRQWYTVLVSLSRQSAVDTTLHVKLRYDIDGPFASYVGELESNKHLMEAVTQAGLTSKEFVLLTALVGTGWTALRLVDSLGPSSESMKIDPQLIQFFQANRVELDSLNGVLARSKGRY